MDLQDILKKTKERSDGIKRTRAPVSIATEERPYEVLSPPKKVATNRKQSKNKVHTSELSLGLVGIQLMLFKLLRSECGSSEPKITRELTLAYISKKIKANKSTIKTSL